MSTVSRHGSEFAAFPTAAQACRVADALWLLLVTALQDTGEDDQVSAWDPDGHLLVQNGHLTRTGAAACEGS